MQFKPFLFNLFASNSSFLFFFFSLIHHLFYLYIHQLCLFLSNLHHYLHILPPWLCLCLVLSCLVALFHEEIVFHAVPDSKVISDTHQFVNNSGMLETINSTELGPTQQSMELNGKLELQTSSNFLSWWGFSKKQALCFQFYSDWCAVLIYNYDLI